MQRKETGAWLTVPPVSSLGLRLEDDAVRMGIGLCLGVPLCSAHTCNQVDVRGTRPWFTLSRNQESIHAMLH